MNPVFYSNVSRYIMPFYAQMLFIIASLVMMVVVFFLSFNHLLRPAMTIVLLALACVVPLAGFLDYIGLVSPEAVLILWGVSGLGTTGMLICWCLFLADMQGVQALLCPVIGAGFAALLILLSGLLAKTASVVVILLFPLLSLLLFFLERRSSLNKRFMFLRGEFIPSINKRAFRHLSLLRSVIGTFINSVCLGFALYYFSLMDFASGVLICGVVLFAVSVIRLTDFLTAQVIDINFSVRILIPIIAIAMIPIVFMGAQFWLVCCCLLLGISSLIDMVGWSALSDFTRVNRIIFTLGICYDRAGNLIGLGIGFLFSFLTFGTQVSEATLNPLFPGMLVALAVCLQAFVFKDNHSYQFVVNSDDADGDESQEDIRGPWRRKCDAFSQQNHLSPRESQVLLYLVKGRDAGYIEKSLFISGHTAKAHIYNIYRKTNVHSKQELIDLIEAFEAPSADHRRP
jgi:DNA-binding CsgD family transcriptional regulator